MEQQLNPLAATHLLQQTLRSLCIHENSQWVYAVFWRILPRNYPPPKWDVPGGAYDRSRGNRRNWILVWEDGFCNFAASTAEIDSGDCPGSSGYGNYEFQHLKAGLQPEVFFKMSHEVYNYGEGLIGKVAADHSHKWVFKEQSDQETNFVAACHNPGDSHPRTWEAQFQCGIKTIALIAVREGVVQLGALHKVMEDLSYIVLLRKKFSYLESIPGVLLPHSSPSAFPFKVEGCSAADTWPVNPALAAPAMSKTEFYNQYGITPSMSSLEALLSKLPSVVPSPSPSSSGYCESTPQQPLSLHQPPSSSQYCESAPQLLLTHQPLELMVTQKVAKEEIDEEYGQGREINESTSSMSSYHHPYFHYNQQQHYLHHPNVRNSRPNKEL